MAQVLVFKIDRVSRVWCNFKPAWLLVSNYRNFWKKMKDGTVVNSLDFSMKQLFQLQKRLSKQH